MQSANISIINSFNFLQPFETSLCTSQLAMILLVKRLSFTFIVFPFCLSNICESY